MATDSRWFNHPVVAGVVGLFAGALAIMLIEFASHRLLGAADPAQLSTLTTPMFASVLVAWVIGAWTAGMVATAWAGGRTIVPGAVGGLILLAGSVATMIAIPHPLWVVAGALILMPAATWFAARGRVARRE